VLGPQGGSDAVIQGDAGYITAAAGARVAIISRWNIRRSGTKADGISPRLRFRASFSWVNDVLMNLKHNGIPLQKRVIIEMRTERHGVERVDILGWSEWRYEGGMLTLEDIIQTESGVSAPSLQR
jgi:hypothetical protein